LTNFQGIFICSFQYKNDFDFYNPSILAKLNFFASVPGCHIAGESNEKWFLLVSLKIHATQPQLAPQWWSLNSFSHSWLICNDYSGSSNLSVTPMSPLSLLFHFPSRRCFFTRLRKSSCYKTPLESFALTTEWP
jgi:hypothetical protein